MIQVLGDRPTLFWNVDWRYASTQAWGIARFGNVSDSLDYAGQPVEYHVGPSWIAGALNYAAAIPISAALLIAVPITCVVVVVVCGHFLLRRLGASNTAAELALTVVLCMPNSPYLLLRRAYGSFRGQAPITEVATDAEQWFFSLELMLNSLFATAVGLSAAALLVQSSSVWRLALGAGGLASLMAIKPQYAVGLLAVVGLGLLVTWTRSAMPLRSVGVAVVAFVLGAFVTMGLNSSAISFTSVRFSLGGAVGALDPRQSLLGPAILVILVLLLRPARRRRQPTLLIAWAFGGVLGAVVLSVALGASTFLVDAGEVARANDVGLPYAVNSQDANLDQALRPVTLVLVAVAVALAVGLWERRRVPIRMVTTAAVLVVVVTVPLTVAPLLDPMGSAAYEVSEEADLGAIMEMTPENEGRWLSNDLADPAQDFARPLRATSLTAFSSRQFYLANVAYMGWTQPDVVQRVRDQQRFFLTEWSPWHADFLKAHQVAYLAIRDRCGVAWPLGRAGSVVNSQGAWTMVAVAPSDTAASERQTASLRALPTPAYGRSGCLDGSGPLP